MSEGGQHQRVPDLLDDPNALEKFLGGLTSDAGLLPESVDNVVASLARSLEADYEVDSPNETLFDTLESNNLTDISRSYVPSDFENAIANAAAGGQQLFNGPLGSLSNGQVPGQQQVLQGQQQQSMQNSISVTTAQMEEFLMSTAQSNSISTLSSQQYSNCDPSSQFLQQELQVSQSQTTHDGNNSTSFSFSQEDLFQKQVVSNQSQQQQHIIATSLSSSSSVNHQSQIDALNAGVLPNSNDHNSNQGTPGQNAFQSQQTDSSSHVQSQQVSTDSSFLNTSSEQHGTSGGQTSNVSTVSTNEVTPNSAVSTFASTNANSNTTTSATVLQQQQPSQQFITNGGQQLISTGAGVSLANVGGQLIATSSGNIMTTGQSQANIIQQLQAGGGQGYIIGDQSTLIASPNFGANLLLATGGTPTYAVVNAGTQFLSNAIMTQQQAIQTLAKGPNGTFFQTAGGPFVSTSSVNQIQNVTTSPAPQAKPKQPPQLLPKPQSSNPSTPSTTASTTESETTSSSVAQTQSNNGTSTTESVVTHQVFQQQQTAQLQGIGNQVVVTSVGSTVIPQQSFTIGGAAGIGQVVMSQNHSPQTQLTGTIVVNQYGQPMLVPSAGQGGLQFFVRQPSPLLTLQSGATQIGAQGNAGKPNIVRYLSQMPQIAQTPGYGLQQIQTPNGLSWVAVRYPQPTTTLTTSTTPFQIQADSAGNIITSQNTALSQPQTPTPLSAPSTPAPSTPQPLTPRPSTPQSQKSTVQEQTPDSSSEPPPAKKAKSKPKSNNNKKGSKVTLDLEELLKQSGIMDEDLTDDPFDFGFGSQNGLEGDFSQPASESSLQSLSSVQEPSVATSTVADKPPPKKKSKKRKADKEKPPTPPPPPPPAPPTPKSSSKSKKKSTGQKPESKTESSKTEAPKKLSSLDDISATIDAVAAAARSPSPPSTPTFSITASSPAPSSAPATPATPIMSSNLTPNSPAVPSSITKPSIPSPAMASSLGVSFPLNGIHNFTSLPSLPPNSSTTTRIVQTIQLTPQNQQLLKNIQAQITRLLQLPSRNDTEHTALQKLIVLQQQVIATGIPVPNPTHMTNLPQSTIATASASVTPTTSNASLSTNTNNNVSGVGDSLGNTVPAATCVLTPASSLNTNKNVIKISIPSIIHAETGGADLNGRFLETMSKVDVQVQPSAEQSVGVTEENKENSSGGTSTMVVASSNLASGTNTTNSLGQSQVQSFPSTFKSTVDDKKSEELRTAVAKAEADKRARWKKEEFEMLLKRDQQCVTQPDYEVPFTSKKDAVERLMRYHILRDRNDMNFEEFDQEFGEKACVLLDKFHGMMAKYRSLLLKESMKEVGSAERVMLERMFVAEEKVKLEQDRQLVNQGEIIELPPPPPTWVPKIQEMVDQEMKDLEQNSYVSIQTQSAIDSIIGFGSANQSMCYLEDTEMKVEYDAFGVPINNNGGYGGLTSSSADLDEAVRSILS